MLFRSKVYDCGDYVLRKCEPEYWDYIKEIVSNINNNFVKTEVLENTKSLKHEKHIITYPYEWSANLFKDAVLFHLELFIELNKIGWTLKDALPNNILYNFNEFKFVDIPSLIKQKDLKNLSWLKECSPDSKNEFEAVFEAMFLPYMLIPYVAFAEKRYSLARKMLSSYACNVLEAIKPNWGMFGPLSRRGLKSRLMSLFKTKDKSSYQRRIKKFLKANPVKGVSFYEKLYNEIKDYNLSPSESGYSNYYESKKEDYDFSDDSKWQNKQKAVKKIIEKFCPKTVLDLGANTGWFSLLAEDLGASILSLEIDESSIDKLYRFSKKNNKNIIPLCIPFENLEVEFLSYENNLVLYSKPIDRLKSDCVMCLALFHHLVLGMGIEIDNIVESLFKLTGNSLILEFIDLNDDLILNEPSFFTNLDKYDRNTYSIEILIEKFSKYFEVDEILESHPSTRKIIVFKRKAN